LSASTRISDSITHWLIGDVYDWITNASVPRTESLGLMNVSPLAKSRAVVSVTVTPTCWAISSASSG
jgi:hypothetical protein